MVVLSYPHPLETSTPRQQGWQHRAAVAVTDINISIELLHDHICPMIEVYLGHDVNKGLSISMAMRS